MSISSFYGGSVLLLHNRITDVRERLGQRFAISSNGLLGSTVQGDYLAVQGNYIDTVSGGVFIPILLGDDNGIAFLGTRFDSVDITNNTLITNGENEYELTGGSRLNFSNNVISTTKRFDTASILNLVATVGYPRLHGGLPASIAMRDDDFADTTIQNNDIDTRGGATFSDCMLLSYPVASTQSSRSTTITGNRCDMGGIFAGMQIGWFGATSLLPSGIFDNAVVARNTFTGTASFGIAALDYRYRLPFNVPGNLNNTSNHNLFSNNDFSTFTPSQATLYLGPSTHDNTFIGDPHGPVVNLGTDNHIVPTP